MASPDDEIRRYLTAVTDPDALKDEERIRELGQRIEQTDDPLEQVRLVAEQRRLGSVRPEDHEPGFVEHAKRWAEQQDPPVTAEDFRRLGVSARVLADAGFDVSRPSGRDAVRKQPTKKAAQRRTRVSREDVARAVTNHRAGSRLTASGVQELTGASAATVRGVLGELTRDGTLTALGPDPDHTGRGRAPTLYERR